MMLIAVDNYLAKITMGAGSSLADEKEQNNYKVYGLQRRVRLVVNQGIEVFDPSTSDEEPLRQVYFGDHKMDALRILGNPNKEYYKDDKLILNYLEMGVDVVIDNESKVCKFIIHTNFHYHPHFAFYNRCFYELDLYSVGAADSLSEALSKLSPSDQERREESKAQKKKRKKQEKAAKASSE